MSRSPTDLLHGLPAAERILEGLRDLEENRHTIASCLVRIASPRLGRAGLMEVPAHDGGAELDLYRLLAHEGSRAHSAYNALLRELVSFEHALDHRLTRAPTAVPSTSSDHFTPSQSLTKNR